MNNRNFFNYNSQFNKLLFFVKILLIMCLLLSTIVNVTHILIICIFYISLTLCIRSYKKSYIIFVIFCILLYINYSIIMSQYLYPNMDSMFTKFFNSDISYISLQITYVFNLFLFLYTPESYQYFNENDRYSQTKANMIVHICIWIAIIFILIFGLADQDIKLGKGSTIFWGYSILLFLLGLYYCGDDKKYKITYFILMCIFCFLNIKYGLRLFLVQTVILMYVYFCPLKIKNNFFILFAVALIGYVLFIFLSVFRENKAETFIQLLEKTIDKIKLSKFTSDTITSSYFTSETFVNQTLIDDFPTRIIMLLKFLLSMIFGGTIVKSANLAEYTREFVFHYYGGILPHFGYYYGDFIGVVLFSMLLVYYLKFIDRKQIDFRLNGKVINVKFPAFISIYIVCTSFNWLLYSPSNLIRGVILLLIADIALLLFNKITNRIIEKYEKNKR